MAGHVTPMISAHDDVISWGHEQARAGPWRGDRRTAYLVPLPEGPVPSIGFVRRTMDDLAARGFSRVVTNALSTKEQVAFLGAGFEVREELCLLGRDLAQLPAAPPADHRRARRADHRAVLDLDARAFSSFWHLDERGLADAIGATPRARFRVVTGPGDVVAYALTGRAGRRGFLQRLAVHPRHRRQGLGSALVVDALRWLRRRRVHRVVVNTPSTNHAAISLYESLGFHREPEGLAVLGVELDGADR